MSFGNEQQYISAIENGNVVFNRGEYRGWLDGLKEGATIYVRAKKGREKGRSALITSATTNRLMVEGFSSPFSRNDGFETGDAKCNHRLFPSALVAEKYEGLV